MKRDVTNADVDVKPVGTVVVAMLRRLGMARVSMIELVLGVVAGS